MLWSFIALRSCSHVDKFESYLIQRESASTRSVLFPRLLGCARRLCDRSWNVVSCFLDVLLGEEISEENAGADTHVLLQCYYRWYRRCI